MVSWKVFRPGGAGGAAVYDYGSNQRRLVERVGNGGTLWLVTSTRRAGQARNYHLAYKLVDCSAIQPEASLFSGRYPYVVRAQDWRASRHFGLNDASSTLKRLQFASGKPMAEVSNRGLRLLSIPELTSDDVTLLERLQHQIEQGRSVFLSYSHKDTEIASTIESELVARDVSVSRDVTFLRAGQPWEEALQREVMGTDCFVVLVSPNSAARDSYVPREVKWAVAEQASAGLVTTIVPIMLPGGRRDSFPELEGLQWWDFPDAAIGAAAFDRLAEDIAATTRGGKRVDRRSAERRTDSSPANGRHSDEISSVATTVERDGGEPESHDAPAQDRLRRPLAPE